MAKNNRKQKFNKIKQEDEDKPKYNTKHKFLFLTIAIFICVLFLVAFKNPKTANSPKTESSTSSKINSQNEEIPKYEILEEYTRDSPKFTQGLVYYGNTLVESTGMYGESVLQVLNLN